MLSRGRRQDRRHENEYGNENLQLSQFDKNHEENEEDVYPDSDTAFLQRHRLENNYEGDSIDEDGMLKGIFTRILNLMSRSPLLGASSSTGGANSYGALNSDDQDDNDGDDQVSSSAFRNGVSDQTLDARRRRPSCSGPRSRTRAHGKLVPRPTSPMLIAEPGLAGRHVGDIGGGLPADGSDVGEDGEDVDEAISIDENDNDPPDNSPYSQVRASVAATDNISVSINTPRMWTLSMLCALLGSATNLFFSLRYPSVAITPVIALVVVHPLGRAWDALLKSDGDPLVEYQYGLKIQQPDGWQGSQSLRRRIRLWLSQGAWNEKEHACVYISSNVAFGFAFATDVIVEQHKFYKQEVSIMYQVLLTVSTQILGYSFAGLTRRYLVRPPSMQWPGILMASAMFTTIHSSENHVANGWKITRLKFFLTVFFIASAWYFVPGLLMPALSYFNVITWFAPENVVIANLVS